MKIEVLLSTMYQSGFDIVKKCNIKSDAVIVNQCGYDKYEEKEFSFGKVRMYSNTNRGLSKSRNLALNSSVGDICLICDEDVEYVENYVQIVTEAFNTIKDADVIVFNINRVNAGKRQKEKLFKKIKRIPKFKTYGSVHIAFRRKSIVDKNICFNELFGSGSGMYSMAEDSIFFRKIHSSGLKAYTYPEVISTVSFEESSWFNGYNEKYCFDVGAFLVEAYPNLYNIVKWYYPLRLKKESELKAKTIISFINKGIEGYKNKKTFNDISPDFDENGE